LSQAKFIVNNVESPGDAIVKSIGASTLSGLTRNLSAIRSPVEFVNFRQFLLDNLEGKQPLIQLM
jgi:hypothetical protein